MRRKVKFCKVILSEITATSAYDTREKAQRNLHDSMIVNESNEKSALLQQKQL